MYKGIFITLEGPDGAGKSTQIENIRQYFLERGREVILTREPGGTAISEKLREILLDPENKEMTNLAEMMIYAAARAQHCAERIEPALRDGRIVICDRFADSSIAYQGYGRGLGDVVQKVNDIAVHGVWPDVTFFLDVDPEIGRARIGKDRLDRLEQEQSDFHYRVYEGYKTIWKNNPKRVIRIDANQDVTAVRAEIFAQLDRIIAEQER